MGIKFALRLLFANSILCLFLYWTADATLVWINWDWQQRFSHIFLLGISAIIIYIVMLWISGLRYHDLKAQS
jgi:putative peptidoglycan lipid II flippase